MSKNQSIRILRLCQVESELGLKKTSIYKLVKSGYLKPPVRIGGLRAVGWLSSDINDFLDAQIKNSRKTPAEKSLEDILNTRIDVSAIPRRKD